MKIQNNLHRTVPLLLICVLFVLYTGHFVYLLFKTENIVVVNNAAVSQLEEKSTSGEKSGLLNIPNYKRLESPIVFKVKDRLVKLRETPDVNGKFTMRLKEGETLFVHGYPNSQYAEVSTTSGVSGFVEKTRLKSVVDNSVVTKTPLIHDSSQTVKESSFGAAITKKTQKNGEDLLVFDVPIMTYHHITNETGKYLLNLTLPVPNFLAQLDWLVQNNYETITFKDLKAAKLGERTLDKAVILSFDDGYGNLYQAAQHLNGKGLRGVFFIITNKIGQEGYLSWRQVRKMQEWGMEIGSHGVESADLTRVNNFYRRDELERSKQVLEQQLGVPVISFSYPAGKYNNNVVKLVEEVGYEFARTTDPGSRYTDENLLTLPTLRVFPPAGARQFEVWLGEGDSE